MEITITNQAQLFLTALLVGAALAAVYDVFRILRIAFPSGTVCIAIEDICYFILCTFVTFTFILRDNEGMVRSYILLGEVLGWVLYYFTLGSLVISCSKGVIRFCHRICRFFYRCFLHPIFRILAWFGKLFRLPLRWLRKQGKKVSTMSKYNLKHTRIMLYNLFVKK